MYERTENIMYSMIINRLRRFLHLKRSRQIEKDR